MEDNLEGINIENKIKLADIFYKNIINALSYMKNYIAVESDFGAPEAVKCEFEEVIKILETITIEDLENFTEWADKNNKTNELNEFKTLIVNTNKKERKEF